MNLSAVKSADITYNSLDEVNGIIDISYQSGNSNLISKITDGVGRIYTFSYNNGKLSNIVYNGNENENLKTVAYSYSSDGTLSSVTFSDNKTVNYQWADNTLDRVTNTDGYNFVFTYTDESLPRIKTVKEYASDGTLGEDINISYSVNKTTYTDNKTNKQEILQFDKYGNLLTSQNADGYTLVNQYGSSKLNTSSSAPNELINSFGYQKSEINLLSNTRALNGNSGWSGAQISANESVFCTQSLKLVGANSSSYQSVTLEKDKTYVFSAYVKTKNVNGSLGATIKVNNADVTLNSDAQYVTGSSKWTRIATTFKANSNCTAEMTLLLNNNNTLAEAYFDGVQLEKGTTVSDYNYVLNADFNSNDNWLSTSSENVLYSFVNEQTPFDNNCIKLIGDSRYANSLYQQINYLNGKKGDTYNFGGWAKANSAVIKDNRAFGIRVEFYNGSDLVGESCDLSFNSYIND